MANKKTPFSTECGRRLRSAREALGLSSAVAFVNTVNGNLEPSRQLTPQKLSNYESGGNLVPVEVMIAIWRRFGITLEWVYGGDLRHMPMDLAEKMRRPHIATPPTVRTKRSKAA